MALPQTVAAFHALVGAAAVSHRHVFNGRERLNRCFTSLFLGHFGDVSNNFLENGSIKLGNMMKHVYRKRHFDDPFFRRKTTCKAHFFKKPFGRSPPAWEVT